MTTKSTRTKAAGETHFAPAAQATRLLLPPDHAFVLQFLSSADTPPDLCAGRVEHVVSGRSARFRRYEEIFDFVNSILHQRGGRRNDDSNDPAAREDEKDD